jgi:hypothetical protein
MLARAGAVMIVLGLGTSGTWLIVRWLVSHEVYFAPTLTPGARDAKSAEAAKVWQQRQVVVLRRWLVPLGLLVALVGLLLALV